MGGALRVVPFSVGSDLVGVSGLVCAKWNKSEAYSPVKTPQWRCDEYEYEPGARRERGAASLGGMPGHPWRGAGCVPHCLGRAGNAKRPEVLLMLAGEPPQAAALRAGYAWHLICGDGAG